MRISNATKNFSFSPATAALSLTGLAGLIFFCAVAQAAHHDYEWSGKLISYDSDSRTAVVQAPIESYVTIDGINDFADGDRLILTWTGVNWAAGIRGLAADPQLTPETLSLPVEFVSTELDGRYLNFRVPVPSDAVTVIEEMESGTQVRGISPKMATDWSSGITELRHYNDIS